MILFKKFVLTWGMVILYVLLNSYGALMLKYKINQIGSVPFDSILNTIKYFFVLLKSPLAFSAVIAIFLSAFVWMSALSRMEISLAYPFAVGLNFLIVVLIGVLFFSESLTASKVAGIILILISIYLLKI